MIVSYLARLVCLFFASFFLAHLIIGLLVLLVLPRVLRASRLMRPRRTAQLLFFLRMMPAVLSFCLVAVFCVPSYLRYEQNLGKEDIGFLCLTVAALGLMIWTISITRGTRAVIQYLLIGYRTWAGRSGCVSESAGGVICLSGEEIAGAPLLALMGILRTKIVVSKTALAALSADQLEVALAHERAHQVARDNLKRLLVLLLPDLLPFIRSFRKLERQWECSIELAADDGATYGHSDRSLLLAEALIRVAQLSRADRTSPLMSSLSASDQELMLRVDRLLTVDIVPGPAGRPYEWYSAVALLILFFTVLRRPDMLHSIYGMLERFLR